MKFIRTIRLAALAILASGIQGCEDIHISR
jgi:hypothetical protein